MAFGPDIGQEGSHVGRFVGESFEQVGEVVPSIDGVPFGAGAEAHQDRGGPEPGVNRGGLAVGSGDGLAARVRVYRAVNFTATVEPTEFQDLDLFGGGVLPGGVYVG